MIGPNSQQPFWRLGTRFRAKFFRARSKLKKALSLRSRVLPRFLSLPLAAGVPLAGCTTQEAGLLPGVESQPISAFAMEACSRRIAQLAAPYQAKSITSFGGGNQAQLLAGDRYSVTFAVTLDYGAEKRTARVHCIVTQAGRVDSVEGMG
jgi:hypothetical protein